MISVLTITYKRHHLLEEAIESFLRQGLFAIPAEMVIINDCPEIQYEIDHPLVRIINCTERFASIGEKLEYGYKQCKYNYIYRLDDDDLLMPWAIENVIDDIKENPGYEIYRSSGFYFFENNVYKGESGSVNNGNVYTRNYLDRIKFPQKSGNEDQDITFGHNAKIYESSRKYTMAYRWGMSTLHISGLGEKPNEVILAAADTYLNSPKGQIKIRPHFMLEYFKDFK